MQTKPFLVEIQTEELPPKSLQRLAQAFLQGITAGLQKVSLTFSDANFFATPRRLAVLVENILTQQPDSTVDRKGPALKAAFDAQGNPTPACLGFARSCGVDVSALNQSGEVLTYQQLVKGKKASELLPDIVRQALETLPIAKRMRWGTHAEEFVRPVHHVVMLLGDEVIEANILGQPAGRNTCGHRFHCQQPISIPNPLAYQELLKHPGFVIADFTERKNIIRQEVTNLVKQHADAHVLIDENLLDEVTGLVEWPIAIYGSFPKEFLEVPQEALISAMQDHQRYFPIVDHSGKLLPNFVAISNLESQDIQRVIAGNERVLRARLSDAAFFFMQDKKITLTERLALLKKRIFQEKLGSVYDKAERLSSLSECIAEKLQVSIEDAKRAGLLAKTDLTTAMVGEFPELQGVMGYYYALESDEKEAVAIALKEHYLPRFSQDILPDTLPGCVVGLADRIDTLVGIFGINQLPSGDKDPFGLRRAALGILRIVIEKKMPLDLKELLLFSVKQYQNKLSNQQVVNDVLRFIQERLKYWYQEQGVSADIFAAVAALELTVPYDIYRRVEAVAAFKKLPDAESLSVANKRVSNILSKSADAIGLQKIDASLFENSAERELAAKLAEQQELIRDLSQSAQYKEILTQLASLRKPVDDFFDQVLVMAEDKKMRENRLLLLKKLRELFLHVADIALLQ